MTKIPRSISKGHFSGLGKARKTSRATSHPLEHGSTFNVGGHHPCSLALPHTKRVDRGFILYRDRRCVAGWCVENRRKKNIDPSLLHRGEQNSLFRFGRRAWDAVGNLSPPQERIHMISSTPSSTFTCLAQYEAGRPRVSSVSRSNVFRRMSCSVRCGFICSCTCTMCYVCGVISPI